MGTFGIKCLFHTTDLRQAMCNTYIKDPMRKKPISVPACWSCTAEGWFRSTYGTHGWKRNYRYLNRLIRIIDVLMNCNRNIGFECAVRHRSCKQPLKHNDLHILQLIGVHHKSDFNRTVCCSRNKYLFLSQFPICSCDDFCPKWQISSVGMRDHSNRGSACSIPGTPFSAHFDA